MGRDKNEHQSNTLQLVWEFLRYGALSRWEGESANKKEIRRLSSIRPHSKDVYLIDATYLCNVVCLRWQFIHSGVCKVVVDGLVPILHIYQRWFQYNF